MPTAAHVAWATAALALTACPSPPTAHEVGVTPSASPPTIDAAPPPSVASASASPPPIESDRDVFCRRIREERDRVTLRDASARGDGGPGDGCATPPPLLGSCVGDPPSRWAYALEDTHYDVDKNGQPELGVRWALVHGGAAETRVHLALPPFAPEHSMPDTTAEAMNLRHDCYDDVVIEPPNVFDWDGDGDPEIVAYVTMARHEAGRWSHGRIWTYRDGKLDLYAPAKSFSVLSVEDVDGDGRPDAWTHGPYSAVAAYYGSGFDFAMTGPRLLAHSLRDGTFSMDDAVASAADQAACADAKGAVVDPDAPSPQAEGAVRVVCARLRGESAEQVLARIARECRPNATGKRPGACLSVPQWTQLARATPPLRFKGAQ